MCNTADTELLINSLKQLEHHSDINRWRCGYLPEECLPEIFHHCSRLHMIDLNQRHSTKGVPIEDQDKSAPSSVGEIS